MSTGEGEETVEVLYDYSYSDEQGLVEIHEGDVYRLLEKTNSEWWHVCAMDKIPPASEDDDDGFFVPAQYVRVVKGKAPGDQEVDSAISSLDDVLGAEEEEKQENNVTTNVGHTVLHSGGQSQVQGGQPAPHRPPSVNGMGKNIDTDGDSDYVNLDQYRADAKIPPLDNQNASSTAARESDYANLPFQLQQQKQQEQSHSQEQGPRLQDGHFVRILVEGLPWDVYVDQSGRKFFHNRETGELTWKPPRKDKPSSPVGTEPAPAPAQRPPSFPGPIASFSLGVPEDGNEAEEDYTKTEEGADVFFINNSTNEKWQQLTDESGRQYYHRLGSNDTQWDLPTTPRSRLEGLDSSPRNGEAMGEDGAVSSHMLRSSKAKSMYGKIEPMLPNLGDPKACTLPPNFAPGSKIEKSPSLPSFQLQPPSHHRFEDQFSGFLNKAKIAEVGKKKVRKNWAQTFLVLQASNLVFYKDQKAAAQKPGSPHGRPDGVISLQGARVDFNLPKDITSRRNTIMLSVNSGSQFLLHTDDEKTIHEWLVRLKIAANDIAEESPPREHEGSTGQSSGGRSMSEGGISLVGEAVAERGRNLIGIRAKLLNFLIRRPTQEDLIKQGIIKDAVFGSSLQHLCDRDRSVVPNFILECITAVENKGLEHDGLYRVSGNLSEIQKLRYIIDKDEDHNLMDEQWDIHTLTGALKLFFRELKEPLFPFKFVNKFLDASKKESRKDKLKAFKEALSSLPKCNYETMRVLFQHLTNVVQFSAENRMQTQNVAIVFGPTLMWSGEGDFTNMAIFTVYQSKVVEFLLLEYTNLFR